MKRRWMLMVLSCLVCGMFNVRPLAAHNPDPNDPLESASPILKVADVEKSIKYFVETLGFHEEFKAGEPPNYAGVSRGKVMFHLSEFPESISAGRVYIYVKDKTLDKLHEELKKKGAQITTPPTEYPYGMREFAVKTPDGHVLTFAQAKGT